MATSTVTCPARGPHGTPTGMARAARHAAAAAALACALAATSSGQQGADRAQLVEELGRSAWLDAGLAADAADGRERTVFVRFDFGFTPEALLDKEARSLQRDRIDGLQRAWLKLVGRTEEDGGRSAAILYPSLPGLALRLDAKGWELLVGVARASQGTVEAPGGRPVGFHVDPVPILKRLDAGRRLPFDYCTPGQLRLEIDAADPALDGAGYVVVVIDDGINDAQAAVAGCVLPGRHLVHVDKASLCATDAIVVDEPGAGRPATVDDEGFNHGTRVAGMIHAVAPGAKLLSLRVDDGDAISTADVVAALAWIGCHAERLPDGLRIAAVCISLGDEGESGAHSTACPTQYSLLSDAVESLRGVGIPVVVAAGNDGWLDAVAFPACLESMVTVGGTIATSNGGPPGIWRFGGVQGSNWGDLVDVTAPASGIGLPDGHGGVSWSRTGTSIATPVVAAAFALVRQARPGRTAEDVQAAILASEARAYEASPAPAGGMLLDHPRCFLQVGDAIRRLE